VHTTKEKEWWQIKQLDVEFNWLCGCSTWAGNFTWDG